MNKLRFFKPVAIDGKIVHGEFQPFKVSGTPPVGRFGHTLNYMPCNNSLLVAGGKLTTIFYFICLIKMCTLLRTK